MIVEQVWTGNAYRNFNYLVACPETGDALAIDPLELQQMPWRSQKIAIGPSRRFSTHTSMVITPAATRASWRRRAPGLSRTRTRGGRIPDMDRGVTAGDVIKVGKTVETRMPGYARTYDVPYLPVVTHRPARPVQRRHVVQSAGAGNCHNGGHPEELYETFSQQLETLGEDTLIYPGHDYLINNLPFTLDREPDNRAAQDMLETLQGPGS